MPLLPTLGAYENDGAGAVIGDADDNTAGWPSKGGEGAGDEDAFEDDGGDPIMSARLSSAACDERSDEQWDLAGHCSACCDDDVD